MMSSRLSTDRSYDADLYHRALTGRGVPVTGAEVCALLETLEVLTDDYEKAIKELRERSEGHGGARGRVVPQDEPFRSCDECIPAHDRGDGRCERHGRLFPVAEPRPLRILSHRASGRRPPYPVVLDVEDEDKVA